MEKTPMTGQHEGAMPKRLGLRLSRTANRYADTRGLMQHLFRERRSAVLLTDAFLASFCIGLCVIEAAVYRTAVQAQFIPEKQSN